MALLQVLKVSVPATAPATGTKDYYFQGGYVYKDAAVATATGISIVTDFQNDEPLCLIEQLVLSKKIMRFVAELETTNTAGKKVKKTASIYSSRDKAASLLGGNTLNGKSFKVFVKNAEKELGKIKDIRSSTRDTFN